MNDFGKITIKSVVSDVDKKYIRDREELSLNLDEALKNKYIKVGKDEEKYIELLRYNIIFYKSIIKKLEVIIEMWVQNGVISSTQSVEKSIVNITNSSKEYVNIAMKKGRLYLNDKDKKIFVSYDNSVGLKRIEKVENDYKILNLYKDILSMMISVISEDPIKYNVILDMSIEKLKIDIMNEVFVMINEILFSVEREKDSFTDEALVDEDKLYDGNIDDEEKCLGFKKYVAMISSPEISVRINDIFRSSVELENIDEEDANLFNPDFKDYISCAVILMDYVSAENRVLLKNIFRMFISNNITQAQFEETFDKIVIDRTFVDKRTWLECQNMVKAEFNLENNNFFGESKIETEEILSLSDRLDIVENLTEDMSVEECIDYMKYSKPRFGDGDYSDTEGGFASKLKQGLFSFSEKLKSKEDSYDLTDEYGEEEYHEYDEYDYDASYYADDEDLEDYEKGKSGFMSKLKNFFKGNDYDEFDDYENCDKDDDFDNEYDDFVDGEDETIDSRFDEKSPIQDKNAVAILKLREKNKKRELAKQKAEIKDLKDERKIAEEINKVGIGSFKNSEIVFTENDVVYKKSDGNFKSKSEEVFQSKIDGQISFDDFNGRVIPQIDDRKIEAKDMKNDDERSDNEAIISKSKDVIKHKNEDSKKVEVEAIDDKKEAFESELKIINSKKIEKNGSVKNNDTFEELENLKSMNTSDLHVLNKSSLRKANIEEKNSVKAARRALDKAIVKNEDEDIEKRESSALSRNLGNFKDKIIQKNEERRKKKEDRESEGEMFPKSVVIRDFVIVAVLLVAIFASYVYMIKGFNRPSVEETNRAAKQTQTTGKTKNTSNSDYDGAASSNTKSTTEITQKTEAEKEKDEIEKKASALDREAENYKSGKGTYYTVFVGAVKSEDAANTYANSFAKRGVNSKVVRNGGFYMLKVGEYFDINQAYSESYRITSKGIQNYVATQNKYYELKIEAFKIRSKNLSVDQIKTDYNDIKNQISSTGKNDQYIKNLDEIYNEALKSKQ
ncbi:SPOR domain-containing protein [Peptostreptococcus sp. D1]|uniref:SPOR domain-containing protein n=1 Tax=Peptostreptococcus sp. D1 TaxID=72304 RepID=UPI0008DF4DF4|nr:SPOR domain-containing protein [Peptostreptococcus sp. D1]SFE17687.1 Sporulation related domain-containing protein [Peptostreptococcus sp. D1]